MQDCLFSNHFNNGYVSFPNVKLLQKIHENSFSYIIQWRHPMEKPYSCGKTLDNNDLNQVMASSGFSENKGLGGVLSLAGS